MQNPRSYWTREQVVALKRLAEGGAQPAAVALQLKRPEAEVRRKASEQGVRFRRAADFEGR